MRKMGILIGLLLISSLFNVVLAQDTLLFEGYLNKGEYLLVGPLVITVADVQKNYLNNTYQALIVVTKDGKVLNTVATPVITPNTALIQSLLSNQTFLILMGETLGYNMTDAQDQLAFYQWLQTASEEEIFNAILATIQAHPELGLTPRDLVNVQIKYNYISENETIELDVDGEKVTITALQIYPNGAKLSISGPYGWKASTLPAFITTSIEIPEKVNPGNEFTIKVHLKNEGALKARYINVIVSPMPMSMSEEEQGSSSNALAQALTQSGVVQSLLMPVDTATKYIEYLEGKEEKTLEFKFKVNENAAPGIYPVYVTVIYSVGMGESLQQMQSFNYAGITVARESDATFVIESVEKPDVVYPGEDFEVKVKLRNVGGEEAKNVLVALEPVITPNIQDSSQLPKVSPEKAILISNNSNQYYTAIVRANGEVEYKFKLHVSENAKTGSYPVNLKLTYYSGDAKESKSQSFEFSVQVLRKREAFIEIESIEMSPKKIEPGDEFTLKIKIKNVGEETARAFELKILPYKAEVQGEIKNVDLSSLQNLPIQGSQAIGENLQTALNQIMQELAKRNVEAFLPIGEDNSKYVSEIQPNQEVTLEFHIKANDRLENGVYPLRIGIEYLSTPDDEKVSDERLMGINVLGKEELIISKVSTSPSRVLAGTNNVEVSLEVENIGSGTARYILLKPKPKDPFELSETSEQVINLGTLRQGDSAKAVFRINVKDGIKGGTYEIPVEITYKDSLGETKSITLTVPIIVNDKPKIVVESVRFDKTPMQGEDVKVYVKVKNVGGEQAENVIIEGVVKASQPFTLTKRTDYIGTLDPGKSGEGVIELSINRDAIPKEYTIQVRIRAVGDKESGDDNVYVFEDSIKVPVEENTKQAHTLKYLGVGIGVLAVLAIIITYLKRRE
ncbi:hypothetical protein E3E31_07355 [Thermococcus sp. M39]|uniref:COG1361 S-layer family protein n=1 Tax=unclassified Thermococcus TaxID=2627626 RepID=UPI00143B45CE|nr:MULTISPECIES: COG1361 S-layer family protein [unclassified Thermococcus]NJE08340.1 hypothetical protein [Thermococcus sp. M39]NJE11831.1 hypothetical protein [Thermococcus sp. LS2]